MGSDVASRVGWQCFNVWWRGAPGVEGLVPWLAATAAKTVLGDAGRRGPDNNHPVRRRATDDRQSGPVRPTSTARPKACGDRSMAQSSRCDRAASRKALAGRPRGRETDTAPDPLAAGVAGCLRCGGDGRSTRTMEEWSEFSAAPAVARAFSMAWLDLRYGCGRRERGSGILGTTWQLPAARRPWPNRKRTECSQLVRWCAPIGRPTFLLRRAFL